MITLTDKDLEHLAELARLKLSDGEKDKFRRQLSAILDYVAQIQRIPTSDIAPTMHATRAENVLRPDRFEACPPEAREDILGNAPDRADNFFRVPPVFG